MQNEMMATVFKFENHKFCVANKIQQTALFASLTLLLGAHSNIYALNLWPSGLPTTVTDQFARLSEHYQAHAASYRDGAKIILITYVAYRGIMALLPEPQPQKSHSGGGRSRADDLTAKFWNWLLPNISNFKL